MQCLRNSLNGILFFLLYFDAVSCFYEEKQQDEYTTAILNITFCDALKKNCHSESGDGKFGLNSPKEHVSGWLVLLNADNHNGCKSFSRTVSPELKPTIVLLIRGDCNFKDKISNAYKYNASAVVIYNNQGKDKAVSMSHAGEYHIVSVSVSQISGEKLASKLQNATVYVEINVGQQRTRPKWKVNPTSVLFVSVSFIVLMVISLAWLVFYYVQRFRYVHARDKTEKRLTSAAKKAIAKLPVRTVNRRDEPDETESCAVCLDGYKAGDQLRILPCNHEFHKPCIDPWLVEHRTCPMCKLNILKELGLSNQQENMHMDAEMGIAEAAEDHNSANDNPVVSVGEMGVPRRNSQDSSSDGSAATRTRLLISADLSWERESTSTSNLVDNSSLRT